MTKVSKVGQGFKPIATRTYIDKETGEELSCIVADKEYKDSNFYKVWLMDLANVIDTIGGKKIKVLTYILANIQSQTNQFLGTNREIAEATKASLPTVNAVLNLLMNCGFLVKLRISQYMVNPDVVAMGSNSKRSGLLIQYHRNKPSSNELAEVVSDK